MWKVALSSAAILALAAVALAGWTNYHALNRRAAPALAEQPAVRAELSRLTAEAADLRTRLADAEARLAAHRVGALASTPAAAVREAVQAVLDRSPERLALQLTPALATGGADFFRSLGALRPDRARILEVQAAGGDRYKVRVGHYLDLPAAGGEPATLVGEWWLLVDPRPGGGYMVSSWQAGRPVVGPGDPPAGTDAQALVAAAVRTLADFLRLLGDGDVEPAWRLLGEEGRRDWAPADLLRVPRQRLELAGHQLMDLDSSGTRLTLAVTWRSEPAPLAPADWILPHERPAPLPAWLLAPPAPRPPGHLAALFGAAALEHRVVTFSRSAGAPWRIARIAAEQ